MPIIDFIASVLLALAIIFIFKKLLGGMKNSGEYRRLKNKVGESNIKRMGGEE